jgi:hypothetical protein
MKKYLFKTIQTLLVFSLAFTLTNCGNLDNPLEELSGGSGDGGGSSSGEEDIPTKYEFSVTNLAGDDDLTANITSLELTDGEGTVIATAELSEGKYTVEKSKLASATIVWVKAVTGTGNAAKTYIQKLVAEDLTALETSKKLTVATIGDVITSEGAFAAKGAAEEQAVIAYVGKVDKYFTKFLAIALEDAASNQSWANALTKAGEYAAAHAITIGGTTYNTSTTGLTYYDQVADNKDMSSATATDAQQGWRLPSVTDLRYILDGLGRIKGGLTLTASKSGTTYSSNATPEEPLGVLELIEYRNGSDGSTLLSAINTACGNTALQLKYYWSSSKCSGYSDMVWSYGFNNGQFVYANESTSTDAYVRAVFAY